MEFETLPDGRRIAPRRPGDPEDCDAVEQMAGPGCCDGCIFRETPLSRDGCPKNERGRLSCLGAERNPKTGFSIVFERRKTYGNEE